MRSKDCSSHVCASVTTKYAKPFVYRVKTRCQHKVNHTCLIWGWIFLKIFYSRDMAIFRNYTGIERGRTALNSFNRICAILYFLQQKVAGRSNATPTANRLDSQNSTQFATSYTKFMSRDRYKLMPINYFSTTCVSCWVLYAWCIG